MTDPSYPPADRGWAPSDPPTPFFVRHADALYSACEQAIRSGHVGSRTPIGDQTLEYRDERDRIAAARPQLPAGFDTTPPRGPLPDEMLAAARMLHPQVWTGRYRPGEGPLHHAGGPYWREELLRQADEWERLAAAARQCAQVLPDA